jgi:hypothetical protein
MELEMKYSRMLCWVRPHEKKELKKAVNGQFLLVFAKNYDDFRNQITDDSYLIISLSKTKFGFKKIQILQNEFSVNKFHFYAIKDDEYLSVKQFRIMESENSIPGQYIAKEFVDNFLGIIPDLYKMRESEELPQDLKDAIKKAKPKIEQILSLCSSCLKRIFY